MNLITLLLNAYQMLASTTSLASCSMSSYTLRGRKFLIFLFVFFSCLFWTCQQETSQSIPCILYSRRDEQWVPILTPHTLPGPHVFNVFPLPQELLYICWASLLLRTFSSSNMYLEIKGRMGCLAAQSLFLAEAFAACCCCWISAVITVKAWGCQAAAGEQFQF